MKRRSLAALLTAVFAAGSLGFGFAKPAQAANKEKLYRYGTYLGGAAALYGLSKGNATIGLIGAGLGLLSYTQWKKHERARHRAASYRRYTAYRSAWYRAH